MRQLDGRKVSSASASTAGENVKEAVPTANIIYVRDYAAAFAALKDGSVDAFTTDETVLRAIVQRFGKGVAAILILVTLDQPCAARYRSLGRGGENLRRMVRPDLRNAAQADVPDRGRLVFVRVDNRGAAVACPFGIR